MRKYILLIVLTAIILLSALVSANTYFITINYDLPDKETASENYAINVYTHLSVLLKYGGDYYAYYLEKGRKEAVASVNPVINSDVDYYCKKYSYMPKNASAKMSGRGFLYSEGYDGKSVDGRKVIEDVFKNFGKTIDVKISQNDVKKDITIADVKEATKLRASFTTTYGNSSKERKNNIKIAAKSINEYELKPNCKLSFNDVVGARTIEKGYLNAGEYSNGKIVDGIGGGVCQVSTTLYNCCLLAGLKILSVSKHSMPVSYVEPSFDAMVSEYSDLVVYNQSDRYSVFFSAYASDEALTFNVYSPDLTNGLRIKRVSRTKRVIEESGFYQIEDDGTLRDKDTKIIFYPHNGCESEGILEYYDGDKKVYSKTIRNDVYNARKGCIMKK